MSNETERLARRPAVRIVHPGGPAARAMVFIDGKDVSDHVTCIDLMMDVDEPETVRPVITFADCALDVGGELVPTPRPPSTGDVCINVTARQATNPDNDDTDRPPAAPERRPWFVFYALIAEVLPAGLAWWAWQLRGAFPSTVFSLSVLAGLLLPLGTVGAFLTLSGMTGDDQ